MAKGGKSKIQTREAVRIADKLASRFEEGSRHRIAIIEHDGVHIANFGIRRGSNVGHGYIPKQIFVSETQAVQLATCTMSRTDYIAHLKKRAKL